MCVFVRVWALFVPNQMLHFGLYTILQFKSNCTRDVNFLNKKIIVNYTQLDGINFNLVYISIACFADRFTHFFTTHIEICTISFVNILINIRLFRMYSTEPMYQLEIWKKQLTLLHAFFAAIFSRIGYFAHSFHSNAENWRKV